MVSKGELAMFFTQETLMLKLPSTPLAHPLG
jgi:hypothetical protein